VTVAVGASGNDGNFAFSPAGIWIDPGTTVTWEWTGEGGEHNVVANTEEGPDPDHPGVDSGEAVEEEGHTYQFTFEEPGMTPYVCVPHRSLSMFGAVAVGNDVETESTGGGGAGVPSVPDAAKSLGVGTFIAMIATLGLAFFFMKYGGTYDPGE